jgi:stage V sporulation protein R
VDYSINELKNWNEKIEKVASNYGLDYYPQEFEMISFEDMLCYEAYVGMPSHYPHWSFGKAYEKLKTFYRYNLTGLPYEMVINSNPSIAYLMKDNTLLLQILTMSHVYGHKDFFKNNRLFKEHTNADLTIEMFKNHANRIRDYIQDPSIGYEKVERILDAAHSIKLHCRDDGDKEKDEKEENLLRFLVENGDLEEWERDLLTIVMEENQYFIPQIETKIMNEGWASWWHYHILQELDLDKGQYLEFLKMHNGVICPATGRINPYYVGFKIWEDISKRFDDPKKMFEVRALERDASFIRKYLTFELSREMNLFKFDEKEQYYIVTEVADEDGWKNIRNYFAGTVGMGNIPIIRVKEVIKSDHTLYLEHVYDGRELELTNAFETLKYIGRLWSGKVILETTVNEKLKNIICNDEQKISLEEQKEST